MRTITVPQAQQIIKAACDVWRKRLINNWKNNICLGDDIIYISDDDYRAMREACTTEQHKLFDEIFGVDGDRFKGGDWVTTTTTISSCYVKHEEGETFQITEVRNGNALYEPNNGVSLKRLRKATKKEIEKAFDVAKLNADAVTEAEKALYPEIGTLCLVWDDNSSNKTSKYVRYYVGQGKFANYETVSESTSKYRWDNFMILDTSYSKKSYKEETK